MALIDFGMKARRELAELREDYEAMRALAQHYEHECNNKELNEATLDFYAHTCGKLDAALEEIASSTAKHASAVRLANIARKALGRPVGGGEQ